MTMKKFDQGPKRFGGIAPLTCVLLVAILGMVAFAVDISWMVMTQSELQNAADAASHAGASKLADNFVLYSLPTQSATNKASLRAAAVTAAKSAAQTYAAYHSAGGVNLTLLASDIDVGFTNGSGTFTSYATNSSNYPNTVKATMRRDSSANTPLGLFFAPVLGISDANLVAPATAMLYTGTINSFKVGTANSGMMPLTYDINDWNNFIASGKDKAGVVNKDSSGNPILQIYGTVKDTGNFGLLSLNDSHVGASTISGWINEGVPPSDIQTLVNNKLIPLSAHNPKLWDWQGDTGFKATNAMDLNAHVGETYILPLFTPAVNTPVSYSAGVGQGANYFYNIVAFVGVKIMPASQTNRQVWIQPVAVSDPNFVLSNPVPAGTGTFSTAMSVRLTQ